jgi:hypothetical protein
MRQFRHQEGKLVGNVDAHKKFLRHISISIGVGENHIYNFACTAQRRRRNVHRRKRSVASEGLGRIGLNGLVANRQVIQRAVLIGCPGIVRHLHDAVE